jgi:hypothetical protein
MTRVRLKYVHEFRDRHGKPRHYFRRTGFKRMPLPGLPGSAEFMEAYQAALAETPGVEIGASRTVAGTVNAVVIGYVGSAAFHNLATSSQRQYRGILERLRRSYGDRRIAKLERRHVMHMLDDKAATPVAARDFLRCLRVLIRYAIDMGLRGDDPTVGIRVAKPKTDGFRTWTEDDIAAFEAKHPIGTKPRLALALLLHTAQRRGDVVRMGRQHIRDGVLLVRQQKTGRRSLYRCPLPLRTCSTPLRATTLRSSFRNAGSHLSRWHLQNGSSAVAALRGCRTAPPMDSARQRAGGWRNSAAPPMRLLRSAAIPACARWSAIRRRPTTPVWLATPSGGSEWQHRVASPTELIGKLGSNLLELRSFNMRRTNGAGLCRRGLNSRFAHRCCRGATIGGAI